jgi:hypothetical protein
MQMLGWIICCIGLIVWAIGEIWLLINAFRTSLLWGICCLLLPIAPLIFLIVHWRMAATPWLIWLLAFGIYFVGFLVGGWDLGLLLGPTPVPDV